MRGSECLDGYCTNAFTNGGCLKSMKAGWDQLRVCNSEDSAEAASKSHCRPVDPQLNYMEIRILTQNWESSFFESWVLQILLSEILGIPSTIETGSATATVNFYDQNGAFEYGKGNDFDALRKSAEVKDCRLLHQRQSNTGEQSPKNSSTRSSIDNYQSCGHVMVELWMDVHNQIVRELEAENTVESPIPLGALGIQTWHIPKFTAVRDPTLLSYFGMIGEENRRKLAGMFLRPTTWEDYCDQVSPNNCQSPDSVATRAPIDDTEKKMMFSDGLYTGHFRKTDKNDCDSNPMNCTGHIADYPCGWTSFIKPQTQHLNIPLESDGEEASGGYTHSQLIEMWAAANATKSNIVGLWWTPEILYSRFKNTDAELLRVALPLPTQECIESRVSMDDRCSDDLSAQIGDLAGACDDSPQILQKLVSVGLTESINDPSIPLTRRNPGYEAIRSFQITQYQVGQFFEYWLAVNKDKWSHDPREAACRWFVENIDYIMEEFVPPGYPRTFRENTNKDSALFLVSLSVACLSAVLVFVAGCTTFMRRQKPIVRLAQIEFLFIVLVGLFLVSVGAIVQAAPPIDATCVFSVWLINLGYTMELVPLIVKVAAINRIMHAAKKMKRVVLNRSTLFGAVALINSFMAVFLVVWTALDAPYSDSEDVLSQSESEYGEKIVFMYPFCNRGYVAWTYATLAWNVVLLFTATILAYQARNHRKEFNESASLATMIYSHFVFLVLRLITFLLESFNNGLKQADLAWVRSLIFSMDAMATLCIYFVPKFVREEKPKRFQFHRYNAQIGSSYNPNIDSAFNGDSTGLSALDDSTFPHRWQGSSGTVCLSHKISQSRFIPKLKQRTEDDPPSIQMGAGTHTDVEVPLFSSSRMGDFGPLDSLRPPARMVGNTPTRLVRDTDRLEQVSQ